MPETLRDRIAEALIDPYDHGIKLEASSKDARDHALAQARALLPLIEQYGAERAAEVEGSFRVGGKVVTRTDYLALTDALEFGDDGFQSPAAHPSDLIDPLQQAMYDAHEHAECPVVCELCGERLAATICERCHGSGCLPNAALAYLECDHCAGVGRIHEGCAEQSYADLRARAEAAEATLREVRVLADEWERLAAGNEAARGKPTKVAGYYRRCVHMLRAVLDREGREPC